MDFQNRSVPFKIDEVASGFQEANGLLKVTRKGLDLEFEVSDAFFGVFKSGVKNVFLDFNDLRSVSYKKGWFSSKIILEGTSMKVFDELPGTDVATVTLKIKRKHREDARSLISHARMLLSEHRLQQLEDGEE